MKYHQLLLSSYFWNTIECVKVIFGIKRGVDKYLYYYALSEWGFKEDLEGVPIVSILQVRNLSLII